MIVIRNFAQRTNQQACRTLYATGLLFCLLLFMGMPNESAAQKQAAVFEGIEIAFEMLHVDKERPTGEFMEGDHAIFRFTIRDTLTGEGISGANPGAWMEPNGTNTKGELYDCGQLITSFLTGSMFSRAELDLNVYYVLTLNEDHTVSVVDPLFSFGGSQLLGIIDLESPGADLVVSPGQNHVFVTQPQSRKVAMISTANWTIEKQISLNAFPYRMALQPDQQYLWIEFRSGKIEGFSGVAAISAQDGNLMASIPTGEGEHAIAFSDDSRNLFVGNTETGTVSVIDPSTLQKTEDIPVGGEPSLLAWSEKSQALYVTDQKTGLIKVIDGRSKKIITTIEAMPGAVELAFERTGRFAFLIYPDDDRMQILDAASNRIVQTGNTESRPTQLAFSDELAYISHANSETVLMVPLDQIGREGTPIQAADFPAGQNPPGQMPLPCYGPGMVQAPGGNAMLIANPLDQTVYYYLEGMAAPMGNFSNYKRQPRSVAVIDNSLYEVSPGVYETVARIRGAGSYSIAVFLDAPRIIHCFSANIQVDPEAEAARLEEKMGAVSVQLFKKKEAAVAGQQVPLFVRMVDPVTGATITDLEDVKLRATSPSNWSSELDAIQSEHEGMYQGSFNFPEPGIYYIYAACPSRKLTFSNPQYMILEVN